MSDSSQSEADKQPDRRSFLSTASSIAMGGGLVAGYGTLALFAGQYVYPDKPRRLSWQVVASASQFKPGDSIRYQSPTGELITITRQVTGSTTGNLADEFLALSSVCPHLGCKVHWEAQNNRFFCPCHNGAFDTQGNPTAGPPKEAGQSLKRYELKVDESGVVFVLVPTELLG